METQDFLKIVHNNIISDDVTNLIDIVFKYRNLRITLREFVNFISSFNNLAIKKDKIIIGITGSGGSRIRKPNIGTITALYLSRLSNIKVIKTGSVKKTSISGSTDLLNQIGYTAIKNKDSFLESQRFYYADLSEVSKWKQYINILKINESINEMAENTLYNEFEYDYKFTGTIYREQATKLFDKQIINSPKKWYIYGGYINNVIIDEFVPGKNFLLGKNIEYNLDIAEKKEIYKEENIFELNRSLLLGECDDCFWYESLRYTVAYIIYLSGISRKLQDGLEVFDYLYQKKAASNLLKIIEDCV